MDDDIVERLREGALSGDLPLGAAFDWAWVADEIERLRAEVAAFRNAIRTGDGPSCEDVCLVECVGVCGITFEESPC